MIDSPEYYLKQIKAGASNTVLPLRHYPYLIAALRSYGVEVKLDWSADLVRRLCSSLVKLEALIARRNREG